MRYQRAELPVKLDGLKAARNFFAGCLTEQDPSQDSLWVAHVDAKAQCLHLGCHRGTVDGDRLPVDEIIADAIAHHSAGLVIAQNDERAGAGSRIDEWSETKQLAALASTLDCTLIDHLIFTGGECRSLRRSGRL